MKPLHTEMYKDKAFLYFSLSIAVLVSVGAGCGIFLKDIYSRETEDWREQAIGQDIVDLLIISPLLVISGFLDYHNKRIGVFIFGGTLMFLVYSYVIYCFAVHFNSLFLVYCLTLGLSVYALAWFIISSLGIQKESWFHDTFPVKAFAYFLIFVAVSFCFLWLKEIIPAILKHQIPDSIKTSGTLTNPVQVLDLSIFLPGMVITAIFLFRKKPIAFILTPLFLVFCALMSINISVLVMVMKQNGPDSNWMVSVIMGWVLVLCIFFFFLFLKHLKNHPINSFGV